MNNYIGPINAEWVDPAVELPQVGWIGLCKPRTGQLMINDWRTGGFASGWYVAWLRIGGPSDAIPRAKVQAAVDEICGDPADRCGCLLGDCIDCSNESGRDYAADVLEEYTGVTPSEVTP